MTTLKITQKPQQNEEETLQTKEDVSFASSDSCSVYEENDEEKDDENDDICAPLEPEEEDSKRRQCCQGKLYTKIEGNLRDQISHFILNRPNQRPGQHLFTLNDEMAQRLALLYIMKKENKVKSLRAAVHNSNIPISLESEEFLL